MRINITYELEEKRIPLNYRAFVLSIIKEAYKNGDKNLYDQYCFDQKKGVHIKPLKPYTFSIYLPKPTHLKNEIQLSENRMDITFSSFLYEDIMALHNGLLGKKNINYGDLKASVKNIRLLPQKNISQNKILFKTLSPFVLRPQVENERSDTYFCLKGTNREKCIPIEKFNEYLNQAMAPLFQKFLLQNYSLKFTPINIKTQLINTIDNEVDKIGEKNKLGCIFANEGKFYLEAEPEALNFIYQAGLGHRRGYGFGCLETMNA